LFIKQKRTASAVPAVLEALNQISSHRVYDVSPDGKRFLMIRFVDQVSNGRIRTKS